MISVVPIPLKCLDLLNYIRSRQTALVIHVHLFLFIFKITKRYPELNMNIQYVGYEYTIVLDIRRACFKFPFNMHIAQVLPSICIPSFRVYSTVSHDLLYSVEGLMSRGYSLLRILYFPPRDIAPGVISQDLLSRLRFGVLPLSLSLSLFLRFSYPLSSCLVAVSF